MRASSSSNIESNTNTTTSTKDNSAEVVIDLTEESDDDETTITTTTIRSPASSKLLRANSLSQSCSASPSEESIIILDSPPSRSNATPEDPVESFIRASQNIMNSASSSTSTSTAPNPNRNLSPPKKRFKPVSPLVTGSSSSAVVSSAAPTSYGNSYQQQQPSSSYCNSIPSRNDSVTCTPPALPPTPIDYSLATGGYNSYRHSNYYGTNYVSNQSPLPQSPYGGSEVSSTTVTPHSAPPLPNGTSFFPPQPPPLHYGPGSMIPQSMANNYFNMLTSFGQHPRTTPSAYGSYGNQHQSTNNLGVNDLYPLFDSRLQAEYQKFLNSCLPSDNGTS